MASKTINRYKQIEEKALANFELLLNYWGIDYTMISPTEYDFKNPLRTDNNFGACRFNVAKGKGADFAGINFTQKDFKYLGMNFSREDFMSGTKDDKSNWGFNVIGLTQRLKQKNSYKEAAAHLEETLKELAKNKEIKNVNQADIDKRHADLKAANDRRKNMVYKIWSLCKPLENTRGEVYLRSRCIYLEKSEPALKFHSKVLCKETNGYLPAIIMKVEEQPGSGIMALHRIWLKPDGTDKADVSEPKKALASIRGGGVWFGTPGPLLCVVEGPENALSILSLGFSFVVCTISAPNFSNINIPDYVKKVLLLPDADAAGLASAEKANLAYKAQGKEVEAKYPKQIPGIKKIDWNDVLKQKMKTIQEANKSYVGADNGK